MDHNVCVRALAECGASTESIRMIAAFLDSRRMRVKMNRTLSTERRVLGGSPQGTKLGNFLFILTINCIEDGHDLVPPPVPLPEDKDADEDCFGLRNIVGRISAIRHFDSGVAVTSTPSKMGTVDGILRYHDEPGRNNSTCRDISWAVPEPESWEEIRPWTDKYVDDVNAGERHFLPNAVSTFSHLREKKLIRAEACQQSFKTISEPTPGITE